MFSQKNKYVVGIDISDHSIKMVQIAGSKKRSKIISYFHALLPDGTVLDGDIQKPEELKKIITRAVASPHGRKLLTKNVCANVPDSKSFIKLITMPYSPTEDIHSLLRKELEKHLPMDLEEAYYDAIVAGETEEKTTYLTAAVPKTVSESYYDIFKQCGLNLIVFEVEAVALTRALAGEDLTHPLLILDFGHSRSTLTIIDKSAIQLSVSIPLTGDHINQTIAEKLKINTEQAEKAKRTCGLLKDKCKGALAIVLNSAMDDLAFKIDDAVEFYASQSNSGSTFDKIVITGGGAHFLNIENVLKEKTKRNVVKGDTLLNIDSRPVKAAMKKNRDTLHYVTLAYGIALGVIAR